MLRLLICGRVTLNFIRFCACISSQHNLIDRQVASYIVWGSVHPSFHQY